MLKKSAFMGIIVLCMSSLLFAEESKNNAQNIAGLMAKIPGDSVQSGMHIFHQDITFRQPKEFAFNCVYKEEKNGHFITEFIPAGQQLSIWKDMFTLQGFSDFALKDGMSAERLMLALKQKLNSLAAASAYFKEIYKGDVNGCPGVIVLMGVKAMPVDMNSTLPKGAGEIGLYLFLKGSRDMFILHRSWKTDVPYTDEKLPMDEGELNRWIGLLKQVSLTDSASGKK